MKKYVYGALLGLFIAVVMLLYGANTMGAPILTYVYSDSMEPLIRVNDGFLVWPAKEYEVGDIIMYRPKVLDAPFITHRIIGVGVEGYITKGDNSPYRDQESGEPEVSRDRIAGRVLTVSGRPLILPGLGRLASLLKERTGSYGRYLSGLFFILGILSLIFGRKSRKVKPRHRLRLRHLYRGFTVAAVLIIMISIYFGSRLSQIKYLVSEYPGNLSDQIAVNQPDELTMTVKNYGLIPVWSLVSGIAPLKVKTGPDIIWARQSERVILEVEPHSSTGWYRGYVRVFNYPTLLPRAVTIYLHRISPALANLTVSLAFGCYMVILFGFISHIHGLEGFVPLRAIKDKLLQRRLHRAKAKILGRRRLR